VSKRESDISQIRKYLNGELDAKAMHRLERRAQDDPFLMDALEGYEIAGNDQHVQLNELAERLRQRITAKKGRIIPWMIVGLAASVLIISAVGVWWFNKDTASRSKIALTVTPNGKTLPAPAEKTAPLNKPVTEAAKTHGKKALTHYVVSADKPADKIKNAPASDKLAEVNIKDSVAKDTTPLDEMVAVGYATQKKKEADKRVALANADKQVTGADSYKTKKPRDTIAVQLLQGQAAGVAANNQNAPRPVYGVVPLGKTTTLKLNEISIIKKDYASSKKPINGRVVAKDDGLPIPGVTVKIAGTNIGTQTDSNGRFNLQADSGKANLVIGFVGYETQHVSANNRDSIKTISLEPSSRQLGEVVVTSPGDAKITGEDAVVIYSQPQEGWSSFRKYLKENAVSPDGKKGMVKLSFVVDRNGKITGITVKKGLSPATDKKAIDLISNGPRWVGNTNKATEKVNLRIRFDK
jgi:hypothetical protein